MRKISRDHNKPFMNKQELFEHKIIHAEDLEELDYLLQYFDRYYAISLPTTVPSAFQIPEEENILVDMPWLYRCSAKCISKMIEGM
jgi:hypothetical protein